MRMSLDGLKGNWANNGLLLLLLGYLRIEMDILSDLIFNIAEENIIMYSFIQKQKGNLLFYRLRAF